MVRPNKDLMILEFLFVILIISVIRISKSSTSKLQDLSREQKKMANQIHTVLEVMNTPKYPKVVFSAFGSTGKTLKNTTILFDKLIVDINVGNTFNLSMGTFTVPVKGAYEFTFYTGYALGKTEVDVLKNGRKSFKFTNQESNFHLPINSLWHMVLEKGDLVKLFVSLGHIDVASSDGDKAIRIFSGKLLK